MQYLNSVKIVFERVNYNENVAELCRKDSSPVVPPVLGPHDVYLIISYTGGGKYQNHKLGGDNTFSPPTMYRQG